MCSHFLPVLFFSSYFCQTLFVVVVLTFPSDSPAPGSWQHMLDTRELIWIQRHRRRGCRDVTVSVETHRASRVRFTLLNSRIAIHSVTFTKKKILCLRSAHVINSVSVINRGTIWNTYGNKNSSAAAEKWLHTSLMCVWFSKQVTSCQMLKSGGTAWLLSLLWNRESDLSPRRVAEGGQRILTLWSPRLIMLLLKEFYGGCRYASIMKKEIVWSPN